MIRMTDVEKKCMHFLTGWQCSPCSPMQVTVTNQRAQPPYDRVNKLALRLQFAFPSACSELAARTARISLK